MPWYRRLTNYRWSEFFGSLFSPSVDRLDHAQARAIRAILRSASPLPTPFFHVWLAQNPCKYGTVRYVGPKKVVPVIIEGLRRPDYRGYDSAGIAVGSPSSSMLDFRRAPGKLANLEEALRENPLHGTNGIG